MKFVLIGISDTSNYIPSEEIKDLISQNIYFSGGLRHYDRVSHLLPDDHQWISVTVPLDGVFEKYRSIDCDTIVVFVSGDPFFYGFGATLKRHFAEVEFVNYPYFNSLQMHAHRLCLPYEEMICVSCTGRPWARLDEMLIRDERIIGVLTDKKKRPEVIAQHLLDHGFDNYDVYVGENLGGTEERLLKLTLQECSQSSFASLNNLILIRNKSRDFTIGIPNDQFDFLDGRPNMMTKPIYRLHTISLMRLYEKRVFWDVGFCTGSVSVEAKRLYPHLDIYAFEKRLESKNLIEGNVSKFGCPGINYEIGDFIDVDHSLVPSPDAVFIGGHGGKLKEILTIVDDCLQNGGIIATNAVKKESAEVFVECLSAMNYIMEESSVIALDDYNPVTVIVMRKK
ncbi:MAG: precorrin-6y C5,15-methyltransferase (decarboxylating) subunit CbiE [Prolixibacteraceae bacterium]|jgi:precorrin-6Y C5,15-methyltransferase (decarboxylating)|nr:precorrin-6y C5,15-methyltransferase (decarboxylating) subunit CbiE [Prolixibacteraceae bacterium]